MTAQNSYNQAVQGVNNAELSLLQAQANLDSLEQQKADESTSTTAPPTSTLPTTTTTSLTPLPLPHLVLFDNDLLHNDFHDGAIVDDQYGRVHHHHDGGARHHHDDPLTPPPRRPTFTPPPRR